LRSPALLPVQRRSGMLLPVSSLLVIVPGGTRHTKKQEECHYEEAAVRD
jgi:hypothetical protein